MYILVVEFEISVSNVFSETARENSQHQANILYVPRNTPTPRKKQYMGVHIK